MNYLTDKILRGTHRLYVNHYGSYLKPLDRITDPNEASNIIYQQLKSDIPCMIARYGSVEILCINNYLGINKFKHNIWNYITDKSPQFWWDTEHAKQCRFFSTYRTKFRTICRTND